VVIFRVMVLAALAFIAVAAAGLWLRRWRGR
jgi:hypothetical protein